MSCEQKKFLNPEERLKTSPVNTKFHNLKPRSSRCKLNIEHMLHLFHWKILGEKFHVTAI